LRAATFCAAFAFLFLDASSPKATLRVQCNLFDKSTHTYVSESTSESSNFDAFESAGLFPTFTVSYIVLKHEQFPLSVFSGIDRRGWKSEQRTWWDLQLGLSIGLLK
jgi:hypothetical protein